MSFSFFDRLLSTLGGKKGQKKKTKGDSLKKKGAPAKRGATAPLKSAPSRPLKPEAERPRAPERPADPAPAQAASRSLDDFIDQMAEQNTAPAAVAPAPEPVVVEKVVPAAEGPSNQALDEAIKSGNPGEVARVVGELAASAQALKRAAEGKKGNFARYQAELERAIGIRDFMSLSFVGSSLIVDAAYFRDELLTQATAIAELADKLVGTPPKKAQAQASEFSRLLDPFTAGIDKKVKLVQALDEKLIKAFKAKDFASLSDITGALSRDAMLLANLSERVDAMESSEQKGLTATSSSEKAAQLDQQVAQLHQAILDRRYPAISDIARLVSLNAGVLADPATGKAAQIMQYGQQLQQALKSAADSPATAALCGNLSKVAGVFNGPLMDKANQLEGQVNQLIAALKGFDQAKMFTLSVTIARSSAILTDATIQKASLLAGFVPRIEISVKRKDFQSAASALKSALS
jgi:hypothetical protein